MSFCGNEAKINPHPHFDFDEGLGWQPAEAWQPGEENIEAQLAAVDFLNGSVGMTSPDSNHFVCSLGYIFNEDPHPVLIKNRENPRFRKCECGHGMRIMVVDNG